MMGAANHNIRKFSSIDRQRIPFRIPDVTSFMFARVRALRAIIALGLVAFLMGCVQAEIDIEILSAQEGRTTTTIRLPRNVWDVIAKSGGHESRFCDFGKLELNETEAVCKFVEQGAIADLSIGQPFFDNPVSVTTRDGETFRISVPVKCMMGIAPDEFRDDNPNKQAIVTELFKDSSLSIKISGTEIIDTSMNLSTDQMSARLTMSVVEIMLESRDLPEEFFVIIAPE